MQTVVRAYHGVISALAVCAGIIVVAIFLSIVVDVLMRVAGLQPPPWTITYVEYALLYFTMCCAPYLVHHKGHVVIESLVSVLPAPVRRVMEKITYFLCLVGAVTFTYQSVILLTDALASGRLDVRGVDIPMWILFVPMPFSFGIIAIEFIRYLLTRDTIYTYDLTDARDSI